MRPSQEETDWENAPPSTMKEIFSRSPQTWVEDATFSFTIAKSSGRVQQSRKQLTALYHPEEKVPSGHCFNPFEENNGNGDRVLVRWNTFAYPVIRRQWSR